MSLSGALRLMVEAGVAPDVIVAIVEEIEGIAAASAKPVDQAADRRRASDRLRKAEQRRMSAEVRGHSAETSAEMSADPLPPAPRKESFPQTPFKETQPLPPNTNSSAPRQLELVPSPSAKPKGSTEAEFEGWWAVFPRREAKGDARRAFPKAMRLVPLPTLMAATGAFASRVEREGTERRFVPLPATWLNAERWTDEVDHTGPPKRVGFV